MKALLIAIAVAAFGATGAQAADIAARPYTKAPPIAPAINWSGFYAGVNVGYGWGSSATDNVATQTGCLNGLVAGFCSFTNALVPGKVSYDQSGFIGGGQFGYNWQMSHSIVLGIETDFQGSAIRGSNSVSNTGVFVIPVSQSATASQKLDWFGTLRGRVGWQPTGALLVYATGGLAYGQVETASSFSMNAVGGGSLFVGSSGLSRSDVRTGWTAGGGLEWMMNQQWSVKAEYLYYDLGTVTLNQTLRAVDLNIGGIVISAIQSKAHYTGNIVRAGVNYHF
ncbi:porin family protein [soil metagenome]